MFGDFNQLFSSCRSTPYSLFFTSSLTFATLLALLSKIYNCILKFWAWAKHFFHFKGKYPYISTDISHGQMYYRRLTKIKFILTCSNSLLSWARLHRRLFLSKQRLRHSGFLTTRAFCIVSFKPVLKHQTQIWLVFPKVKGLSLLGHDSLGVG